VFNVDMGELKDTSARGGVLSPDTTHGRGNLTIQGN
jgi:hypothetical protein